MGQSDLYSAAKRPARPGCGERNECASNPLRHRLEDGVAESVFELAKAGGPVFDSRGPEHAYAAARGPGRHLRRLHLVVPPRRARGPSGSGVVVHTYAVPALVAPPQQGLRDARCDAGIAEQEPSHVGLGHDADDDPRSSPDNNPDWTSADQPTLVQRLTSAPFIARG